MHHHASAPHNIRGLPPQQLRSSSITPSARSGSSLTQRQRLLIGLGGMCVLLLIALWSGQTGVSVVLSRNLKNDTITQHIVKLRAAQARQKALQVREKEIQAKEAQWEKDGVSAFARRQYRKKLEWDELPEHDPYINWQLGLNWTKVLKKPRVYYVTDFLKPGEAERIMEMASPYLRRSTVVGEDSADSNKEEEGVEGRVSNVRTSQGMFLQTPEQVSDPVTIAVRARASLLMDIPEQNFEAVQVLRYLPGQMYVPHHDWFDPNTPELTYDNGQRVVTMLTWLNEVKEGGATGFPQVKHQIPVKKRDAIFWYNVDEDGKEDWLAEHTGTPPGKGNEKWVAVIWMREKKFFNT